jgi:hypothetical protein
MRKRHLSDFNTFKNLGKYEFFLANLNELEQKVYFSLRKDKKQLIWVARPIDSLNMMDLTANSYFLIGCDGTHGIVFRKKDQRFRIVPLHQPIKVIPKIRRKFK